MMHQDNIICFPPRNLGAPSGGSLPLGLLHPFIPVLIKRARQAAALQTQPLCQGTFYSTETQDDPSVLAMAPGPAVADWRCDDTLEEW